MKKLLIVAATIAVVVFAYFLNKSPKNSTNTTVSNQIDSVDTTHD
ncbi:hypothetical protein [Cellulophaga sp. BC115SP]|nr:hypothetical protein [Cellulophaga sp. BC115SP]